MVLFIAIFLKIHLNLVQEQKFLDFFKDKDWRYLTVEGSALGNTSFLMQFLKLTILAEATESDNKLSKLLDDQIKILYFRTKPIETRDKANISKLNSVALLEFISDVEAFNSDLMSKYIQNRPYNYLIIDDTRKDYQNGDFSNFDELLKFCESKRVKVIVSCTDNRDQKIDYNYRVADLSLEVKPYLLNNTYAVTVEEKGVGYKSYNVSMK